MPPKASASHKTDSHRSDKPGVNAVGKGAATSGRYTAPKLKSERHSPFWLPVLMAMSFLTGISLIVLNYMSLLPGEAENRYLFLGLGWVVLGFIFASNYH